MIVQACLNGARPQGYHPRLPVSAAGLAEDARCLGNDAVGDFAEAVCAVLDEHFS